MNTELRRLFLVFSLLFAALVAVGTYWLWRAPSLEARQGNPTPLIREITTKRGLIYASDAETLLIARNRGREISGQRWFLRRYPQRDLTSHVVGYATIERARTGLEESMNDFLTGGNSNLATVLERARSRFEGDVREGNDLVLTDRRRGSTSRHGGPGRHLREASWRSSRRRAACSSWPRAHLLTPTSLRDALRTSSPNRGRAGPRRRC